MRVFVAGLAFAAVLCLGALPARGQEPDFDKVQIKVSKVAGGIYMLQGAGGNIAASVGDDGIVIVDDQFAPLAGRIQAALKGITDKPVRFVINTHWHFDHTGGNAYFQKQGPIIAQENVRERLKTGGTVLGNEVKPAPVEALPVITFEHDVTVHLNGEDIRAIHFPHGHTDGDAVIFFPKSNVVHMGDDFVTYGFPFIDLESGGSVRGMIAACEKVIESVPADAKIIPGHGGLSTVADLKPYVAMLKDAAARVGAGVKAGKTVQQLKGEKVLAGYEKWNGSFVTTDKFIETLYDDLAGHKGGGFVRHN
jgi:glyoxylase-like metal-dependent hydrolase (beta-lactamase superfamily II)